MTGESSNCTGKVWPQEVAKQPSPDHESDQEDEEDKRICQKSTARLTEWNLSKNFKVFMNEAINQLLKKPARKHPCQKDKPEP